MLISKLPRLILASCKISFAKIGSLGFSDNFFRILEPEQIRPIFVILLFSVLSCCKYKGTKIRLILFYTPLHHYRKNHPQKPTLHKHYYNKMTETKVLIIYNLIKSDFLERILIFNKPKEAKSLKKGINTEISG